MTSEQISVIVRAQQALQKAVARVKELHEAIGKALGDVDVDHSDAIEAAKVRMLERVKEADAAVTELTAPASTPTESSTPPAASKPTPPAGGPAEAKAGSGEGKK